MVVLRWKKLGCGLRSVTQHRKWEWIIDFSCFIFSKLFFLILELWRRSEEHVLLLFSTQVVFVCHV